jgi:hypothetical protein
MPSPGRRAVFSLSKPIPASALENRTGNDNGGDEEDINQTYSISVAPRFPAMKREASGIFVLSRVMDRNKN